MCGAVECFGAGRRSRGTLSTPTRQMHTLSDPVVLHVTPEMHTTCGHNHIKRLIILEAGGLLGGRFSIADVGCKDESGRAPGGRPSESPIPDRIRASLVALQRPPVCIGPSISAPRVSPLPHAPATAAHAPRHQQATPPPIGPAPGRSPRAAPGSPQGVASAAQAAPSSTAKRARDDGPEGRAPVSLGRDGMAAAPREQDPATPAPRGPGTRGAGSGRTQSAESGAAAACC